MIYLGCSQYVVIIVISILLVSDNCLEVSPSVAVLGGEAYMRWTVSTSIDGIRQVHDPSNKTIIIFFSGQTQPRNVTQNVSYTGDISQGIMSFTLHGVTLAKVGKYKYVLPGSIENGGQDLLIAESPDVTGIIELFPPAVSGGVSSLNCSAASTSIPASHNLTMMSEWKKNGININMGSKYSVSGTILVVNRLDRSDNQNNFTCRAYEDPRRKSEESDAFFLNVLYGPENAQIIPAGELNVDEGRSVNMTCFAECNPPCNNFSWWKRTNQTVVGNVGSLVIGTVKREDAGVYICTVTNSQIFNSTMTQKNVSVNYGPDNPLQLSPSNTSYRVVENSTMPNITCTSPCFPSCDFQWTGPVTSSSRVISLGTVNRSEMGNYTCMGRNPRTNIHVNSVVSVFVIYGPDTPVMVPNTTVHRLNEDDLLPIIMCSADCFPNCTSHWYNGTTPVPGSPADMLILGNVYRNETGNYTCRSENTESKAKGETTLQLVIQYAPDVLVNYSGSTLIHSTVLLKCTAVGDPSQYTFHEWVHKVGESEIRRLTGQTTANASTLTLLNISIEDMGTYVCTVDNSITGRNGQIKQTGHTDIFVRGTPFIENKSSMFIGMINKSARIEIPFYSNPSSTTVKFYKGANTVEVTNTSDTLIFLSSFPNTFTFYGKDVLLNGQIAVLHFRTVKATYYGEYTAVLFNDIGSTYRIIMFSSGEPETPANFHITDVQEKQVTLQWLSGDHKGFDQTFVVQISMDNIIWTNASLINAGKKEGWFSATITGLKSYTVYYFRLYSFNVNGGENFADITLATRTLKESACSLDIGASLGIGFGAFFLGVVGTISVIIIRKRITATPKYISTSEADMSTDMQDYANTSVSSSPAPSHYDELQQDNTEKTMYDRI